MQDDVKWITKNGVHIPLTNEYMNQKIRNNQLNEKEIEAIDYWKEGNEGWGYQMFQYASQDKLEEYEPIKLQRRNLNDSKADYLKENFQGMYNNLKSALNKVPSVNENTYLYRYENTYHIPNINDDVKLNELSSFTMKPDFKMTQQFGGKDKIVYKLKGGKDYKNISNVGNAFTQENEALLIKEKKYKVKKVDKQEFYGETQYIVTLE